ncbi:peptidase domain-containing ABC transporter [Rahnella inusitata]|uniref:peptidase domain-containing ABC transporter n=1 Tax=Rahnella inusitata TaxID=58169 RepID=UPI0039BE1DB0
MNNSIPTMVFQSEINECGLACIAMLAETQGVEISLASLREKHPISVHGTSLDKLSDILTELDIPTYPVLFDFDELNALPLPCILHYGAGHYVILAYRKGRHVCVMNPGVGQQFLSIDALKRDISGYALVIDEEITTHRPNEKNKSRGNSFFSCMSLRQTAKVRGIYTLMTLTLLVSLTLFVMPVMVSQAINNVYTSAGQQDFPYGLFLLVFVISTALALSVRWVTERHIKQFSFLNSTSGFSRLLHNPLRFFERRAPGDIFSRFTAWEAAAGRKIELDNSLRTDWLVGLLAFSVLVYMNFSLALVSFAGVTAMGLVSVWAIYRDRFYTQTLQIRTAEQNEFILETLQGFNTIKSSGLVELRKKGFAKLTYSLFSCVRDKNVYEQVKNSIYQLVGSLEMVFFMLLALPLLKDGRLSLGDFFAYSFVRQIFSSYITKIFFSVIQKNQLQVIDNRAEDIFPSAVDHVSKPETGIAVTTFNHSLEYRNLSFRYDSVDTTLQNVSLCIPKGQMLAITGNSGAGKSTLIKVMSGGLIPESGEIQADGVSVTASAISSLFYLLSQEDILFNASVAENISLFDPDFDRSKLEYMSGLLKALDMGDIVDKLPGGMMAKIRESYTGLSLGQRQRLLLARAMYSNRPVIILDEPTANLDDETAFTVANALISHCRNEGKTLIVVTHNTAILPLFDHACCIEQGRLVRLSPALSDMNPS